MEPLSIAQRRQRAPIMVARKDADEATIARYAENLIAAWNAADPEWLARGATWYHEAHSMLRVMAQQADYPIDAVIGAAACLTAASSWRDTVIGLGRALKLHRAGADFDTRVHGFGPVRKKARLILDGADPVAVIGTTPRGVASVARKTLSMYHCCWLRLNWTVADRHHWRYLIGQPDAPAHIPVGREYTIAERSTERAAAVIGIEPGDLQQRLWVARLKYRAYAGFIG